MLDSDSRAAGGDTESQGDELLAPAGAVDLAAENDRLTRQAAGLRRRLAALMKENGALKDSERMWKERALAAGWS